MPFTLGAGLANGSAMAPPPALVSLAGPCSTSFRSRVLSLGAFHRRNLLHALGVVGKIAHCDALDEGAARSFVAGRANDAYPPIARKFSNTARGDQPSRRCLRRRSSAGMW